MHILVLMHLTEVVLFFVFEINTLISEKVYCPLFIIIIELSKTIRKVYYPQNEFKTI